MKQLLLEQFAVCFDRNGWFVAIMNALDGVSVAEAEWKPPGVDNSIREMLNHLTFYNFAYVERFKGIDYEYPVDDNDATFAAGEASEEEWQAEVAKFNDTMNEFRQLIAAADERKFDESVSAANPSKWSTLISNISCHNAYHGGQILLLRKMHGSWDPSKGVS